MEFPFQWTLNDLQVFLLIFFRISGVVMLAPLFGGEAVPVRLRAMIALVLALIVFPVIDRSGITTVPNLGFFLTSAAVELAVGMIVGFAATMLFTAAQFAGQLVDQEMGLSLANVIDPISNQQVSVVGQLKMFLGMIVWLIISGHHWLIRATFRTFDALPVAGIPMCQETGWHVVDTMMRDLFLTAFQIAAPAAITLLLVTIAMAFMARVVPEMNIFILGFSLRLMVGFGMVLICMGVFVNSFVTHSNRHEHRMNELVRTLEPDARLPENR